MDIPAPVKGFTLLLLLLFLSYTTAGLLHAQTPNPVAPDQPPVAYDEAEAYAIDGMIMCPVCPAETIGQAQVPIARQMRAMVRAQLAEGANREEILGFFADRYGQDILAAPPKSGFNLVAWVFPFVGMAVALVVGLLVLRSMSARLVGQTATAPQVADSRDGLDPYLAMVDQELALRQNLPATEQDGSEGDTSETVAGSVDTQRGITP
jgi:cytochrome c-type biogenesis protein CcmH